MSQYVFYVRGMHCPTCPLLIEESLDNLHGVSQVEADLSRRTCQMEVDTAIWPEMPPLVAAINERVTEHGFTFATEPFKGLQLDGTWKDWLGGLVLGALAWFAVSHLSDTSILPNLQGILLPLSVGFAASLSSCLALTGSVILGFTANYQSGNQKSAALGVNISLQTGRLIAFALLGGLLGLVGGSLYLQGTTVALVYFFIALVLFSLGLSILGLGRQLFAFVRLPSSLSLISRLQKGKGAFAPFIAGAFTFFLPCGFALSMMLQAVQSQSFMQGAITMLLFALGTLPVLLVVGFTASISQKRNMLLLKKALGFMILAFALSTVQSGLAYLNHKGNVLEEEASHSQQDFSKALGKQTIHMKVTSNAFMPRRLTIKAGHEITWIITGDGVSNCTNRIIVPDLGINQPIRDGETVVRFLAPEKPGLVRFSCWMAMVTGAFSVEEANAKEE